jgi:hypothetical protein
MKKILFLFCYLGSFFNLLYAQEEGNIWYFGWNAGLDFNSGSPVALTNGMIHTAEGCASISDVNGSLLFYTDGITVWDKTHSQMPNGYALAGGISATQSALIIPFPGNSLLYYMFTVQTIGGAGNFNYSIVDMSLNNGNGDVTSKNVFIAASISEKLCAVKHANNNDIWVMVHGDSLNSFFSYLITSGGVSAFPVISNVGPVFTNAGDGQGYMKFSPDGTKIAFVANITGYVDLFDFNSISGTVTNEKYLMPGATYGLEFSRSGNYLYGAFNYPRKFINGILLQIQLQLLTLLVN